MSRNASGTYTLPSGNPVVSGTLIEASWANTTLSDLATAMTDSLSRSGQGGMTAALRLYDGTSSVPGLAWGSETTTGWYRAGAGDMRLVVTGSEVMKYLSTGITVTGTLGVSGNTTLSGGTANGVAYLNGSKVVTTGSALTFNGASLSVAGNSNSTPSMIVAGLNTNNGIFQLASTGTSYTMSGGDYQGNWLFNIGGAYPYVWNINSSEQMRLTSTGLGIGTSSPDQKLTIVGNQKITGYIELRSANKVYFDDSTNAAAGAIWNNASGTAGLAFSGDGSTAHLQLNVSGNLGLGVTPQAKLNVQYADSGPTTSGTMASGAVFQYGAGGVALNIGSSSSGYVYFNSAYANNAGVGAQYRWYQGATQAMTLDASGHQLVGYTSSVGTAYQPNVQVKGSSSSNYGAYGVVSSNNEMLGFMGVWSNGENSLWISADPDNLRASSNIVFSVDATERARIDSSGNLLVGKTASGQVLTAGFEYNNTANSQYLSTCTSASANPALWVANNGSTGTRQLVYFYAGGSSVGSITSTGSSTTYATSSDYRLKENIAPMQNALAKVEQLKPVTYKWKSDGSAGEGFIAHELQEICPDAVTGEKDAVDEDGNPVYQGIDTSFLVATLTAAIQELKAEFDAYKATHP